jgi:pyruvate kinase
VTDGLVHCTIVDGAPLGERKGVNIPTVKVGLPSVTEQDRKDIRFSCEIGVDAIAASFVRDADAVEEIRRLCRDFGAPNMMIVSKIESGFAVEKFDEILNASDGIMVARGDLGIEIPPAKVPQVQRDIIEKCNLTYTPVITATQMLESMSEHPRPTRAEVTDVANAIREGSDCVMLSGETAAGAYPVQTVKTMAEICRQTEEHLVARDTYHSHGDKRNVSGVTGSAADQVANFVGAKILLSPTLTGRTARIMSSFRPSLPIVATSPQETTLRRCCFYWGVEAVLSNERDDVRTVSADALRAVKKAGFVKSRDLVVITAGDPLYSPLPLEEVVTAVTPTNVLIIPEIM